MLVRRVGWIGLGVLWLGWGGASLAGEEANTLDGQPMRYEVLEPQLRSKLPLAPHVMQKRAGPTEEMIQVSRGRSVLFRILDRRTLQVTSLEVPVGERRETPWHGWITPVSLVGDWMVRDGAVIHGPEGHFNPAVWVMLDDGAGKILHEGWLFMRDSAQTAWDHPRFDLTFLGAVPLPPPPVESPPAKEKGEGKGSKPGGKVSGKGPARER